MNPNSDFGNSVQLLSSHLRHLASVSILAVGGILVLLEIGLLEFSKGLSLAAVGYLVTAILGISFDQKLIIHFVETQEIHKRYKLYLWTTMFLIGFSTGLFCITVFL